METKKKTVQNLEDNCNDILHFLTRDIAIVIIQITELYK